LPSQFQLFSLQMGNANWSEWNKKSGWLKRDKEKSQLLGWRIPIGKINFKMKILGKFKWEIIAERKLNFDENVSSIQIRLTLYLNEWSHTSLVEFKFMKYFVERLQKKYYWQWRWIEAIFRQSDLFRIDDFSCWFTFDDDWNSQRKSINFEYSMNIIE